MKFDLVIIGAGPAGTSAAITAARAGARVVLLEKGRFPRQKVCGEFVSSESLTLLRGLLLAEDVRLLEDAPEISEARTFIGGRVLKHEVSPAARSITRFQMDEALWRSAQAAGVDCRDSTTVKAVSEDEIVQTDHGEFHAQCVINCSGRWSQLKSQPLDSRKPKWIGVKAHFCEAVPGTSVDLYFFEGGYCGVQPIGDRLVNACALVRSDIARSLEEVLRMHPLLAERSGTWQRVSAPVATSPVLFTAPAPVHEGMLQAGDAAAFIDPFAGDGISMALHTGRMAADAALSFIRGECMWAKAVQGYARDYQKRIVPALRNAGRMRQMLSVWPPLRDVALVLMGMLPRLQDWMVESTRVKIAAKGGATPLCGKSVPPVAKAATDGAPREIMQK